MASTVFQRKDEALLFMLGDHNQDPSVQVFHAFHPEAVRVEWDQHRLPKGMVGLFFFREGFVPSRLSWWVSDVQPPASWCLCAVFDPGRLMLVADTRLLAALDLFEELSIRCTSLLDDAMRTNAVSSARVKKYLDLR